MAERKNYPKIRMIDTNELPIIFEDEPECSIVILKNGTTWKRVKNKWILITDIDPINICWKIQEW